ncbi:MAG: M20/M25/M40 family metallo-hydrolase [Bacteroidales bacterium]|nr:M20/M25/M40 family metallo-hydrolase [Bacteroidales bacterium]
MKKVLLSILFPLAINSFAQQNDSVAVSKIYSEALSSDVAMNNLKYLCKNIGNRICGSPQLQTAIEWSAKTLKNLGADTVYLQEVMVHHWVHDSKKDEAKIISKICGKTSVNIIALGESIGTGKKGMTSEVVEVKSFDELKQLGKKGVEGKIVFYNRPMNRAPFDPFDNYGDLIRYRVNGAIEAARLGAVAIILRSISFQNSIYPHTGIMRYRDTVVKIPAIAICTRDADILSKELKEEPNLKFYFKTICEQLPEVKSYNVIGEIRGSENPNNIICVGGHIDSWDTGEGANDDGIGCIQSMEAIRIFKILGIKPKNTIRAVMFLDEEISQRGGKKYAEIAKQKNEKHVVAIESDEGAALPIGFSINATQEKYDRINQLCGKFFKDYELFKIYKSKGGGVDIRPLAEQGSVLFGLQVNSQKYFDYQHAGSDVFESINLRELQLGSAAMTSVIYLIDLYGL